MSIDAVTISVEAQIEKLHRCSGFCALNDANYKLEFHSTRHGSDSQCVVLPYKILAAGGIDAASQDENSWRYRYVELQFVGRKLDVKSATPLIEQAGALRGYSLFRMSF